MRKFIIIAVILSVGLTMVACGQSGTGTGDVSKYPGGVDYSKSGKMVEGEILYKANNTTFRTSLANVVDNDQLKVIVDGKDLVKDTDYKIDFAKGVITLNAAAGEKAEVKANYYAEENPAVGLLVTNTQPTDGTKSLTPKTPADLVGELYVAPNAKEYVTCYDASNIYRPKNPAKPNEWTVEWKYADGSPVALEPLEVAIEVYPGWTKTPQTREMYQQGIMHKYTWDENPLLSWWMWFETNKAVDWGKMEYFDNGIEAKLAAKYPDAKVTTKGAFKHTQSDAKGSWVEYTFTKDGAAWKGRVLYYPLRGVRTGETTFADGLAVYAQAEGPADAFDAAWNTSGYMKYMFQQMLITTPAPQSAQ
jgi:hypothetical protein